MSSGPRYSLSQMGKPRLRDLRVCEWQSAGANPDSPSAMFLTLHHHLPRQWWCDSRAAWDMGTLDIRTKYAAGVSAARTSGDKWPQEGEGKTALEMSPAQASADGEHPGPHCPYGSN